MNDFIKDYPSSASSSGEMFDGAALLLSARNAVQHALLHAHTLGFSRATTTHRDYRRNAASVL